MNPSANAIVGEVRVKTYRTATRLSAADLARMTPDARDRYVDFLRAASIGIVVLGHWLMAAITLRGGRFSAGNSLASVPALQVATWVLQVMPVFFLVGGFSNLVTIDTYRRKGLGAVEFLQQRTARLLRPVFVLLAVWLPLAILLRAFGMPASAIGPATRLVCQPLWFIGVYAIVTSLAPAMRSAHARYGARVPLVLAAVAIAVDFTRFSLGTFDGVGYLNVFAVWLFAQQLGFFYADGTLARLRRRPLVGIAGTSVAALALLTTAGPYPLSMVGLPGDRVSNMSPPTVCILVLTVLQTALVMLARPVTQRWLQRPRVWTSVVAANGMIMTVFLWHLTALLVSVAVLFPLGFPQPGAGTSFWWATRPLWIGVLLAPLATLVGVFARWERPAATSATGAVKSDRHVLAGIGVAFVVLAVIGIALGNFAEVVTMGHTKIFVFTTSPIRNLARLAIGCGLLRIAAGPTRAARHATR